MNVTQDIKCIYYARKMHFAENKLSFNSSWKTLILVRNMLAMKSNYSILLILELIRTTNI
jgi:hypothetical protein